MALAITTSPGANTNVEEAPEEFAWPLQNLKKCKYCNYEH
jgi:hypothetical protein